MPRSRGLLGDRGSRCLSATWTQFFLKFALGDPRVTCVIPGTGKVEHARDNVQEGFGRLPDADERARMVATWRDLR